MLIDPGGAPKWTSPRPSFDLTSVPEGSPISAVKDVDRPGVRVAAVRGHASTAALLRMVKQATPVYAETFQGAVELVRNKEADAFASIREMLLQYGPQLPNSQVLPDSYQSNFAGIAVPKGNMRRLSYISDMLDGMKRDGSLQRIIHDTELRGIEVVAPQ
jgi:polar amino acid transport system substrate-binding protein